MTSIRLVHHAQGRLTVFARTYNTSHVLQIVLYTKTSTGWLDALSTHWRARSVRSATREPDSTAA